MRRARQLTRVARAIEPELLAASVFARAPTDSLSTLEKPVGARPIAEVRRGLRASVEQGQVARGTFSGPRSRGTVFGSQALRHQHRLFMRWSRPPRMVPAPVPQATCPDTRVACKGVARPPDAQGGGGAPGRRPDSRLPPMVAGHNGNDAAADCSLRRPPASVGRRTGAPPPPCRHDVGMLTLCGPTTAGDLHHQISIA